jgi:hypothetical protein
MLRQPIESRFAALATLPLPPHCGRVTHRACLGAGDLDEAEVDIVSNGGEGVCLRPPASFYRPDNFLKIKRLFPDLDRSQID